jgi:hypothetical protein
VTYARASDRWARDGMRLTPAAGGQGTAVALCRRSQVCCLAYAVDFIRDATVCSWRSDRSDLSARIVAVGARRKATVLRMPAILTECVETFAQMTGQQRLAPVQEGSNHVRLLQY